MRQAGLASPLACFIGKLNSNAEYQGLGTAFNRIQMALMQGRSMHTRSAYLEDLPFNQRWLRRKSIVFLLLLWGPCRQTTRANAQNMY